MQPQLTAGQTIQPNLPYLSPWLLCSVILTSFNSRHLNNLHSVCDSGSSKEVPRLTWILGQKKTESLQVKKPIRLATCLVLLTGVSNSRPSSGKEDKLNTAKTHKEAATGTEWNTASAYRDGCSSQKWEVTERKHFWGKPLSLYRYILTSATCANLVYIYCFPLFSIQMHTCKGTTNSQATQVIGGAGGLFLSQVVLAGFNLGPPLTSESSYIGSHNVLPLSEISLMIKQCISLRCCYSWPVCKQ